MQLLVQSSGTVPDDKIKSTHFCANFKRNIEEIKN